MQNPGNMSGPTSEHCSASTTHLEPELATGLATDTLRITMLRRKSLEDTDGLIIDRYVYGAEESSLAD
jgi:hypothetical protein